MDNPAGSNGHHPPKAKPVPKYPQFPTADSGALLDAWRQYRGPIDAGRLRKAFALAYLDSGPMFPLDHVLTAVQYFNKAALCHPKEIQFWTPEKLVADLAYWVKIGQETWKDENGDYRPVYWEHAGAP